MEGLGRSKYEWTPTSLHRKEQGHLVKNEAAEVLGQPSMIEVRDLLCIMF